MDKNINDLNQELERNTMLLSIVQSQMNDVKKRMGDADFLERKKQLMLSLYSTVEVLISEERKEMLNNCSIYRLAVNEQIISTLSSINDIVVDKYVTLFKDSKSLTESALKRRQELEGYKKELLKTKKDLKSNITSIQSSTEKEI